MGVKIGQLKRTGMRKIVKFTDEYGNTQEIKIYEPNEDTTEELSRILLKYSNIDNKEIKINVPSNIVITEFLKKLTDIELPDNQEDINEVIENPCLPFQSVLVEIIAMVTELMEVNIKTLKAINKMQDVSTGVPKDEMLKLVEVQQDILEAKEELRNNGVNTEELNNKQKLDEEINKQEAQRKINKGTYNKNKKRKYYKKK